MTQPQDTSAASGVYAALFDAQAEFDRVRKTAENPHFKSKYANLETVLDAVMPALRNHSLMVVQTTAVIDGKQQLVTTLRHVPTSQEIMSVWELHAVKPDPQGEGSALTYARRYALLTMLGIAPEDDDGNDSSTKASEERAQAERDQAEAAERRRQARERDWLAELDACTTIEAVEALGREAHAVGMFNPNKAQFTAKRERLQVPGTSS